MYRLQVLLFLFSLSRPFPLFLLWLFILWENSLDRVWLFEGSKFYFVFYFSWKKCAIVVKLRTIYLKNGNTFFFEKKR
jgi:hypothetical protein